MLDDVCAELQSRALPLLVPTPNSALRGADVPDQGRWTLSPAPPTAHALWQYEVLGTVVGLCLRTKMPLPLELAHTIWQGLVGEASSLKDYERVDKPTAEVRARAARAPPSPQLSFAPPATLPLTLAPAPPLCTAHPARARQF